MSLSHYLLMEIKEIAEPTLAELRGRLHTRKPVTVPFDTRLVQEEREAR
jgi:hypothetical protein